MRQHYKEDPVQGTYKTELLSRWTIEKGNGTTAAAYLHTF